MERMRLVSRRDRKHVTHGGDLVLGQVGQEWPFTSPTCLPTLFLLPHKHVGKQSPCRLCARCELLPPRLLVVWQEAVTGGLQAARGAQGRHQDGIQSVQRCVCSCIPREQAVGAKGVWKAPKSRTPLLTNLQGSPSLSSP
eukprot:1157454-Pelagomonas_calceolata.AAC.4